MLGWPIMIQFKAQFVLLLISLQSSVIIIGKKMDVKMHRYMQRIEKIIHTPTKSKNNISPIRPTKTPLKNKPNQLDKYIKYELSAKIINNIINRNNQQLVMVFYNMLRNTEYRQKEKIYKFVAIERQQMRVDLGVAAKLLNAVLKQLVKKRFSHFIFNAQIDRPLEFAFKKFLIEEGNNNTAGELVRTSSLNSKVPPKQSNEWFEDMETQNQKKNLLKKIEGFRVDTGKIIIRNVKQSINKLLKKGFQNIKWYVIQSNTLKFQQNASKTMQNQVKIWQQKQKNYLRQIQQLSQKLTKCQTLLLKQSKMNESAKIKANQANNNLKPQNCINNFYCFVSRKIDREKYRCLQQTISLLKQLGTDKKTTNKYQLKEQSVIKIQIFHQRTKLLFQLLRLADKRKLQYESFFFKKIFKPKANQKRQQKFDYLRLDSDIYQQQSNSSKNIDNKSNFKVSVYSNQQTITPKAKPNFHLFVDKIFKLILVISKMLIPLKQGFDKINQYALYSYQIEQKLKTVAFKNLKHSFQRINQYTKKGDSHVMLLSKLSVLQGVIRERLVESFSHIKIISKENDLKIKLIPTTKQFIEQRKIYSQYSLQNWSKLRQNLLQDVKSSNPDKQKKKKITSTI